MLLSTKKNLPKRKNKIRKITKKNNRNQKSSPRQFLQKGSGLGLQYDVHIVGVINARMNFFKNQATVVNYDTLETTVKRLYQTYKYDVAKGGLTSRGRRLEVPGSSRVDDDAQAAKAQAPDVPSPDVTKHSPHVSIFTNLYETVKTEDAFFADNCYISLTTLHGNMTKPNDFKVVPPNTMVCFIAGLDYLNVTEVSQSYRVKKFLDGMKYQDFAYLLKYQMNYFEVIKNNKNVEVSKFSRRDGMRYSQYSSYVYTNCFHNSMWYYPGQVYPNLVNSTTNDDKNPRGYNFYYFTHPKQEYAYKINDPNFPDYHSLKTNYFSQPGNTRFEKDLSDVVEYDKKDLHKNIKLVIAIACRPIFGQKKKDYFQLEVFTYHLNKKMLAELAEKSDIGNATKIESFPRCSQESGNEFYLRVEDYRYEFDNLADRNDNYNHMVPVLYEISEKILTGVMETRDLRILSTLSFTKLYKFILQIPEGENRYNLIIRLVRENYDMLSRNFIDYINIFHYASYLQINTLYFHPSSEKIQYMEALNILFSDTLNRAGLHSFQFSERFLDFHQSYNHTQKILNYKNTPKQLGNFINIQYGERGKKISEMEGDSIEILCRSHQFHLDVPNPSITSLKLNYISQLIFDAGANLKDIDFDEVFKFLPGLKNLELFGIKDNIKLEPQNDCLSLLSFKAVQCEIGIEKFDKFPNLRKVQIENCGNIEELHLDDNHYLQEVILSDLNKLVCLYIGEPGQDIHTIRISNCFTFMRTKSFWIQGKIKNFTLQDCRFKKVLTDLITYFKVENLEIINTTIPVSILHKLCREDKPSLRSPKYTPNLKLHFCVITGDYFGIGPPQDFSKIKHDLLEVLKKIKNLNIYQLYLEQNRSDLSNMLPFNDLIFEAKDIKKLNLDSKKKLSISENSLTGNIRPRDLNHITLVP